ncbi:hypothetical protein KAI32_00350 [Candidatus Pacearchaeota archaeon]|nr:hypothetical protein [Candidatus Pacearchaeota archaeon]
MVKKDEIKVMFCPKCKSVDVKYVFGLGNLFGIVPQMKCSKCGFTSIGFPIVVTNKINLAKKGKVKI